MSEHTKKLILFLVLLLSTSAIHSEVTREKGKILYETPVVQCATELTRYRAPLA